jgi:hypothetical protein
MVQKTRIPAVERGGVWDEFDCWAASNSPEITLPALANQAKSLTGLIGAIDPGIVAALALAFAGGAR